MKEQELAAANRQRRAARTATSFVLAVATVLLAGAGFWSSWQRKEAEAAVTTLIAANLAEQEKLGRESSELRDSLKQRDQWLMLLNEAARASEELQLLELPPAPKNSADATRIAEVEEFVDSVHKLGTSAKTTLDTLKQALDSPSLSGQPRATLVSATDRLEQRLQGLPMLEFLARGLAAGISENAPAGTSERERAQTLWRRGYDAYLAGEYDGAKQLYEQSNQADATYAPAYNSLGRLALDQGDNVGAIALFQKAVDYDPNYVVAHSNLAVYSIRLAQAEPLDSKARPRYLDEAEKAVDRALSLKKEHPNAIRNKEAITQMKAAVGYEEKLLRAPLSSGK